jgi:hypothetical protein
VGPKAGLGGTVNVDNRYEPFVQKSCTDLSDLCRRYFQRRDNIKWPHDEVIRRCDVPEFAYCHYTAKFIA